MVVHVAEASVPTYVVGKKKKNVCVFALVLPGNLKNTSFFLPSAQTFFFFARVWWEQFTLWPLGLNVNTGVAQKCLFYQMAFEHKSTFHSTHLTKQS